MKDITSRILLAVVIVLILRSAITTLAGSHSVHIPIMYGVPYAVSTVCDSSAPIHDRDTGDLSAILTTDGRFLVSYQDRTDNLRIHVTQHVSNTLVELSPPVILSDISNADIDPQFTLPGPKQGPGVMIALSGGRNRIYYTQRRLGDTTGPYGIWCSDF